MSTIEVHVNARAPFLGRRGQAHGLIWVILANEGRVSQAARVAGDGIYLGHLGYGKKLSISKLSQ